MNSRMQASGDPAVVTRSELAAYAQPQAIRLWTDPLLPMHLVQKSSRQNYELFGSLRLEV